MQEHEISSVPLKSFPNKILDFENFLIRLYIEKLNFSCDPDRCLNLLYGPSTKNGAHPCSKQYGVTFGSLKLDTMR